MATIPIISIEMSEIKEELSQLAAIAKEVNKLLSEQKAIIDSISEKEIKIKVQ